MESSLLFLLLLAGGKFPTVFGYSKVSRYGQARSDSLGPSVTFTLSPLQVATPRTTVDLRLGEVVNHPSTTKYSTLDHELVSQLDASATQRRPQERFHPPPVNFAKAVRQELPSSNAGSSSKDVMYPKPIVTMTYDYPPPKSKPMVSKLPMMDSFPPYAQPQFADTFSSASGSSSSMSDNSGPPDDIIYDNKPPANFHPPKSISYSGPYSPHYVPDEAQPPYQEDDLVYDDPHLQHYHPHDHPPLTTSPPPEPMDQRLNKRPYSYYYIGKKLWYVPLYFSIYFIIYIAALVLKSIARHKINFPAHLAEAVEHGRNGPGLETPGWMDYAARVLEAIEKYGSKS